MALSVEEPAGEIAPAPVQLGYTALKARLGHAIEHASRGGEVVITDRYGRPRARIVPAPLDTSWTVES